MMVVVVAVIMMVSVSMLMLVLVLIPLMSVMLTLLEVILEQTAGNTTANSA
jgi:hypothetical protein